jgi:hypothetical protein
MNSECLRISDQLQRAFSGDPWHGPPLQELIEGVTAEQARSRPFLSAHTIWELVLHIDVYVHAAVEALDGIPMPKLYGTEMDWPPIAESEPQAWIADKDRLLANADRLAIAIRSLPTDEKLRGTVPGRDYSFYYLLHGIVQHSLYHGGQIAMVKKAV